jgi:hypothetical protein
MKLALYLLIDQFATYDLSPVLHAGITNIKDNSPKSVQVHHIKVYQFLIGFLISILQLSIEYSNGFVSHCFNEPPSKSYEILYIIGVRLAT